MSSIRGGRGGSRGRGLFSATTGTSDAKPPRGPSKPRGRGDSNIHFGGVVRGASSNPRAGARGGRGDGARRARGDAARGRSGATTPSPGATFSTAKTPPHPTHGSDSASYADRFQAVRLSAHPPVKRRNLTRQYSSERSASANESMQLPKASLPIQTSRVVWLMPSPRLASARTCAPNSNELKEWYRRMFGVPKESVEHEHEHGGLGHIC